jgi:autotransporter-associated beta strand protein
MKLSPRTLASAHLLALALVRPWPAQAGTITKADNAIDLTNALSWVEAVPGLTDIALWDAAVTAANSATMGADMDWLGIRIINPGGAVTIQGPGVLTLGPSGIDMASASADFISQNALALGADQVWNVGSGRTLTIAGELSVQTNKKLMLAGAGTVNAGTLSSAGGRLAISGGILTVSNQLGVLGSGSLTLTNQGWLNLYGRATIGSGYGTGLGVLNLSGGTLNIGSASASLAVAARGQINANGGSITNGSSGSITVSAPIMLETGGLILPAISGGARNVTLSGRLSGSGGLTTALGGSCNTYLTGNNSFIGPVMVKSGYFHNSGTYAIPTGCALTNNAQWAVDKSVTLGSFAGTGGIFRDGGQGPATITAGYNNADGAYAGSIGEGSGSPLSLTKIGSGILTLSGTCSYTGNTVVSNGTLLIDGALKASLVDVRGGGLGGRGIISSNVNLSVGARAVFSDTATLTIAGTLRGAGNPIHLALSGDVSAGHYLLATCGSGATGAFSPMPIVDSGSFAAGTTNYFISTPNDTQIWLVVENQNPNLPEIAGKLTWPARQFLPTFPASAPIIDCIDVTGAAGPVSDLYASLQGIVNRSQPRIACVGNPEEGKFTWMANHEITYRMNSGFNLIYQHRGLLSGLVVPDPNLPDTLNLATTIAGLTNALICDPGFLNLLTNAPYNLPVVMDLRGRFADKYQVYGYLRSNYWNQCTHRIITSLNPGVHGCLRDYIVAIKAACVWLNPGSVTADATALAPFMTGMDGLGAKRER